MTVSDVIRPGDKIDISYFQQVGRQEKCGEIPAVYKSQVLDINEREELEISMPAEGGKLVLLPLGIRYEFVFYSRGGFYRAIGQIKERYKSENVYMLRIELKSQLEKFQRREFFRYPCVLEMGYYTITQEEYQMGSGEAIFIKLREEKISNREYQGTIVDLSGGGIRFYTEQELETGQYVLLEVHLQNESLDKQYYIIGNVISCTRTDRGIGKQFEARAKFLIRDDNTREEIIRFIFEEERKSRQRDRG